LRGHSTNLLLESPIYYSLYVRTYVGRRKIEDTTRPQQARDAVGAGGVKKLLVKLQRKMASSADIDVVRHSEYSSAKAPELAECFIRMRLFLGLIGGIMLGVFHRQGGTGLTAGIGFLYFVPIWYAKIKFLADFDSKEPNSIKMTGILNAIALMALVWITFYTWSNQGLLDEMQQQLKGFTSTDDSIGDFSSSKLSSDGTRNNNAHAEEMNRLIEL
jgi:hypothetical protein